MAAADGRRARGATAAHRGPLGRSHARVRRQRCAGRGAPRRAGRGRAPAGTTVVALHDLGCTERAARRRVGGIRRGAGGIARRARPRSGPRAAPAAAARSRSTTPRSTPRRRPTLRPSRPSSGAMWSFVASATRCRVVAPDHRPGLGGMGKSRLAAEYVHRQRLGGRVGAMGRARDVSRSPPGRGPRRHERRAAHGGRTDRGGRARREHRMERHPARARRRRERCIRGRGPASQLIESCPRLRLRDVTAADRPAR